MKFQSLSAALLLLSACADPMANVARLGEVNLAEGAAVAAVMAGAADSAGAPVVLDQLLAPEQSDAGSSAATPIAYVGPYTPPRHGFWALFGAGSTEPAAEPAAELTAPLAADPTDDSPAGAAPVVAVSADPVASPRAAMPSSPDARQVAPGMLLPYGQIATVCGQPGAALGTRIAASAGYELYDSAPDQTALRVHYLTGFPDGCARIFSAALVLFGDVGTHEVVRYLPSNAGMAQSRTDTAYEQVKAQFCGVSAGQPCGRALDRLAAHSTFVTIYETFGTNPEWGEIFVHQGQVMAIDVRRG